MSVIAAHVVVRARLAASVLAILVGLGITAPASAQIGASVRTVRTYVKQLHGYTVSNPVTGPDRAQIVGADGKSQAIPITQLVGILGKCRQGAMSIGGSQDFPDKTVGRQHFECLDPGAPDKTLQVQLVLSPDGGAVEVVDVRLGGPMYWLPPSPNPPGWPPYSTEKLEGYRTSARAIMESLAKGLPIAPALVADEIVVDQANYVTGKPDTVTLERVGEIIRPCTIKYIQFAMAPQLEGRSSMEAVRVVMTCGTMSSAFADLYVYLAFSERRLAVMQVQAADDYQIPPSAAAGK